MVEVEPYIRAWRQRWQRERERDEAEASRARAVAQRLATLLAERYGATRVLLTGSVARGELGEGSDIDLAAEGIAPGDLFRAGAEAERAAEGFGVDLVPLESASPAYRERAGREGAVLHDAQDR